VNLIYAKNLAEKYKAILAPFCKRIEIAGSIRREVPIVKDIELVCIPTSKYAFEFAEIVNKWTKRKGEALGKYTQRILPEGVMLDLFICTDKTWACNFFIRTGSADFNAAVMKYAAAKNFQFKDAQLFKKEQDEYGSCQIDKSPKCEKDVFSLLGLRFLPPAARLHGGSLQKLI